MVYSTHLAVLFAQQLCYRVSYMALLCAFYSEADPPTHPNNLTQIF
jgi:hypothetical protein